MWYASRGYYQEKFYLRNLSNCSQVNIDSQLLLIEQAGGKH